MKRMPTTRLALFAAAALAFVLVGGCTEKPQTAGTQHTGSKTWSGTQPGFNTPGWKPGDQASWDEKIKQRTVGQNDYVRMAP